jgi:hypothetical protein
MKPFTVAVLFVVVTALWIAAWLAEIGMGGELCR